MDSAAELEQLVSAQQQSFASDNWSGVHPAVFAALEAVNKGHVPAYGDDGVTGAAIEVLQKHFGQTAQIAFVTNGSGANVVGLSSMLRPYEAVICAETAHINVDECGAPERVGIKLVPIVTADGKLTPELIAKKAYGWGNPHHIQPRVISISQTTEYGTCYTVDELRAITSFAHEHNMFVHMDGTRLGVAAVRKNVSLAALSSEVGIDALSLGGTKNGLMFGEAVIFFGANSQQFAESLPYFRKSSTQLPAKMRFVAAQFFALFHNDLWLQLARHSIEMTDRLHSGVREIPGIRITQNVESNAIFAEINPLFNDVRANFPFYIRNEATNEVRWMTSWDTRPDTVDAFLAALTKAAQRI